MNLCKPRTSLPSFLTYMPNKCAEAHIFSSICYKLSSNEGVETSIFLLCGSDSALHSKLISCINNTDVLLIEVCTFLLLISLTFRVVALLWLAYISVFPQELWSRKEKNVKYVLGGNMLIYPIIPLWIFPVPTPHSKAPIRAQSTTIRIFILIVNINPTTYPV